MVINQGLYFRRRLANTTFIVLSLSAAVFGLIWLTFILWELLANGVARSMLLDYGDFAVDARLVQLQALPRPKC